MEIQTQTVERPLFLSRFASSAVEFTKKMKNIGKDDPRRIIHSLKVATVLTVVSAFYYINPIFKDLGGSVMWAVLTVALVMEFFAGAAILKGLNRACATFLAGALGLAAHRLAVLFGDKGEPIVLALLVFLVAALATFARFMPELRAKYDYGVLIFILTFCLVAVSSYRKENVYELAKDRFLTIAIGVAFSFFTSVFVFPVWAGADLHGLSTLNLEKLASFLQSFGNFLEGKKLALESHKSVLNFKSTEDSLSSLARWEPPHGRFRFRHPWDQYQKIGAQSRQCAYLMETLCVYAGSNNVELPKHLGEVCVELSSKCSKALTEAASAMRTMTAPSAAAKCYMDAANSAAMQLRASFSENSIVPKEILRAAPIVSLSTEIVRCVGEIVASVEELARLARFVSSDEMVLKGDAEAADVSIAIEE